MRYEIRVSEAFISSKQNIIKDFNELHCYFIKEQRLFKHHNNYRQIVKKCFIDSIIKFKNQNSSSKFLKKMSFHFIKHFQQLYQTKTVNLSVNFKQNSARLSTFNIDYSLHFTLRLTDSLRE